MADAHCSYEPAGGASTVFHFYLWKGMAKEQIGSLKLADGKDAAEITRLLSRNYQGAAITAQKEETK